MLKHSILLLLTIFLIGFPEITVASEKVDFERDVRPILTRNCLTCHGPDGESRKAGLRLDQREGLFGTSRGGEPIITPGVPGESLLLERVTDPSDPMPPVDHPPLTSAEISTLERWIDQGASWRGHWSWTPLVSPSVPEPADPKWCRSDIDRFILSGLEEQGLTPPAPAAGALTWLRRVVFDLTGLPPTSEQIDAFLIDSSESARKRLVDELLESPAHAEHFARHWLDLMRYAETHGHEFDYHAGPAFEYRDWVIEAISKDLPLDDFVIRQIAGDLLDGDQASHRATGWWWLSQATHGPVDVLADTLERVDNQIDVVSRAFLGATVSCARCHDHKFDAIGQSDWTALSGIIRSTRRVLHPADENGEVGLFLNSLQPVQKRFHSGIEQSLDFQRSLPLVDLFRSARELHQGDLQEFSDQREDRLLWDFSQGWSGWSVTGDAFGPGPHTRDELPEVFQEGLREDRDGVFLATSHDRRSGTDSSESDRRKGLLTSDSFLVDRDYLTFEVAGGRHPNEACVQLLIDGEVIHQVTGENSTQLRSVRWDIAEHTGKRAVLKVIDEREGGWGHISCTNFSLTDVPPAGFPSRGMIEGMARKQGLDKDVLRKWVQAYPALTLPVAGSGPLKASDQLIADFSGGLSEWTLDGPAFDGVSQGTWVLTGEPRLTATDTLNSASRSRALVGTAFSRSFNADQRYLHVTASGESCQVRVSIEGFWMDEHNALLFEGFIQTVDRIDEIQHLIFDLDRYQGRHIHVEIRDHGKGWIAVDRIWLSDDRAAVDQVLDWGAEDSAEETLNRFLTDPKLLSKLVEQGLVDPSRWGGAWNAAVIKPVMEWKEIEAQAPQPRWVLSCSDAPVGRDVPLQIRGESGTPGGMVSRSSLQLVSHQEELGGELEGSGRLKLAQWICEPENPLFWRVQANRIWGWVMGEGLSETPDDFGRMGVIPEQQGLLDYLAVRLANNPSRRDLIRDLVLSQTYAMDSRQPGKALDERDPLNRHWHRAHTRTLKAESIRDGMLQVSGRLDSTQGGPSVPIHLTDFLAGRGRPGTSGPVDGRGRRTIYLSVNRNFLDPFLTVFDFPIPSTTVGKRDRSNLPAQALALMNSPFAHEMAELWGRTLHDQAVEQGTEETLVQAWKSALGRAPGEQELQEISLFVSEGSIERWIDLAHVLFQSKEFRFVR